MALTVCCSAALVRPADYLRVISNSAAMNMGELFWCPHTFVRAGVEKEAAEQNAAPSHSYSY